MSTELPIRSPHTEDAGEHILEHDPQAVATGRAASLWSDAWRELRRNWTFVISATLILLFAVMAIFPGLFTSADPTACNLSHSLERPSAEHWFGYDLQGCDYYARVIYGTRVSILVGIVTTVLSVLIAVVLGSLAGYYGRGLDSFIARFTDIWFAVPVLLGAIVVLNSIETFTFLPAWLRERGVWSVIAVLAIFGWTSMMRLMRSSVLTQREQDYVTAARALGAGDFRIITRHILPNAMAPVLVYATITMGIFITLEATLSFLGVGLELPAISWGLMLSTAEQHLRPLPHLMFFPAIFLSVMVFSFILMGDALRDALDPKLR